MTDAPDLLSKLMQRSAAETGTARAVILNIQDAFRKGDYARIAAHYHEDVDWVFHGPPSVFPDVGHRRGKIAVFKTLQSLNALYRFDSHVSERLIAEGDCAAAVSDIKLLQRASGRVISLKVASFHRVRDGQVVQYRGFTDSFDVVEQVIGHELQF